MSVAACSPGSVPGSRGAGNQVIHEETPEKKPMRRISGVRGGTGELISVCARCVVISVDRRVLCSVPEGFPSRRSAGIGGHGQGLAHRVFQVRGGKGDMGR